MADDDINFEDRYADVPVTTDDEETAAKKAELLKLAAQQTAPPPNIPIMGVELAQEPPPPQMPVAPPPKAPEPPPEIMPQTFFGRLLNMTAPRNLPGAPLPPQPSPPPEAAKAPALPPQEVQELTRLLSKDEPLPAEFQQGDVGPSRDVNVRQAGGDIKKFRGFTPQVESAIVKAAKANGIDPDMLRAFVAIESGGDPNSNRDRKTQYKGLAQIGRDEWSKFGQGDIYNADDNLMAAARLLKDNAARFEKVMGRPPTPREQYLMHQQGLGFYTKGTMTNIAGNLPASAKGDARNWTHEGFENYWGSKLENLMAQAKGAQVTGSVPNSQLAGFMSPEPTATQKAELTGGLTQTPIAAAQTAALMTGTPIEQIKGITDKLNKAAVAGAIKNVPGQIPRAVRPAPGQVPVQGQLPQAGSVTHTYPDQLPVPGMPQTIGPQAALPTVGSTAATYMAMQPKPVAPQPPEPTFMDKLKGIYTTLTTPAGPDIHKQTVADLQNIANDMINKPADTVGWLKRLSDIDQEFTRGAVGAVSALPSDIVGNTAGPAIAGAGQLFGSPGMKQFGAQTVQDTKDWHDWFMKQQGVNPEAMTPIEKTGEAVGGAFSPNLAKTMFNTVANVAAGNIIAPAAQTLGEKFPIPSLISPANASTAFGEPPVVVQTPGGPVVMNDAALSSMVYGGVLTMGFGLGLSQSTRAARWLRENPVPSFVPGSGAVNDWMRGVTDPRRPVTGAPGTQAASLPEDLLKGGTVDKNQALLDIADRQARYDRGTKVGIDPVAADAVYQKYRVQTGAGAQNLVNNAIAEGRLVTDDFRFEVPHSIGKIADYSVQNPDFMRYMKAHMLFDQLSHNEQTRSALPITSVRRQQIPTFYDDVEGRRWTINDARDHIIQAEIDHPEFRRVFQDYLTNLDETRKFVSDGNHNLENPIELDDHTISRPSHPVFSTGQNWQKLLDRVLDNDNPLRIAEDNIRRALTKQMAYDADYHYIGNATRTAFTPRTQEWVNQRGQAARKNGAILKRRLDGQSVYYTTDPLVASLMNSGDVPLSGVGHFFSSGKSLFQSATTGVYAPSFSITGMIRAMEQGWTTAPQGVRTEGGWKVRAAGPLSTAFAIPAQIIPRVLNRLAQPEPMLYMVPTVRWFEDRVSHTPLGQMIDPAYHHVISQAFEHAYNNSFYKRMKDAGAYSESTLQQAQETHRAIAQAKIDGRDPHTGPILDYLGRASRAWQSFINPANEALRAVQEAPNFAWAYKAGKTGTPTITKGGVSRQMPDEEIAMRMRDYTGDPATKGFIWSKDIKGSPETLRYQGPGQDRASFYKGVGQAAHAARMVTPWSGVLFQSPASTLAAMRDNPVRANMAFTMSHVMPEMVAYLWNMNAGQQYVNYQMNGRSDQAEMNNIYIAVPGAQPWEGIEVPHYQEGILTRAMTRAFMQQYFGRNITSMGEDAQKALVGLLKGAVVPPQPSPMTAFLGSKGVVAPEGFMGDIYTRRPNPYEELGGGDSWLELTIRGLAPSIADMALQAHEAGKSAPTWGDVVPAAASQVGKRVASRTALLRDVIGYKPSVSGSTAVTEDLFKYQHTIDDLEKRFRIWDKAGGAINAKGASKGGMAKVAPFVGPTPPKIGDKIPNPGMDQPVRNPMYKMFMDQMEKSFQKDSPDKGGMGYRSMWSNYGIYTQAIKKMRTVNEGNVGEWVKRQESRPQLMNWLEKNGVNPRDYKAVKDFYSARRNDISQKILLTIKATEHRIDQLPQVRQKYGPDKHFSINDVDPNKEGF